jgi:hypothetical protein
MKPGDIVTVYANPTKEEYPIDQAELLEKIKDIGNMEHWWFRYLNESGIKHPGLFKKTNSLEKNGFNFETGV